MAAYWYYIIKVSIGLLVFYTFYLVALRNNTYFMLNRFYLLGTMLLSFLIPVLKISIFGNQSAGLIQDILNTALTGPDTVLFQTQSVLNQTTSFNLSLLLPVIYFTGAAVLFFRLLFSIFSLLRIRNESEILRRFGNMKIVTTNSTVAFSFFNMIFLPKNRQNFRLILEHEMAHVKQGHWFDLIISEIVLVVLWFNPFVFFYKSSLKLQHEYLADSGVISRDNPVDRYLACMLQRIQAVSSGGLVSNFYCKTFKKRIIMITKNKTPFRFLGIYVLIIPILCMLLYGFSQSTNRTVITSEGNDEYTPSAYPVVKEKITKTNGYGERINPVTKQKDFHYAIDFATPEGEKVMTTAKGVVAESGIDEKKGNYILIKHGDVYATFYSHLKSVSVKAGEPVNMGQQIGTVGSTGTYSTGSHLHYEVYKNGERVNPADYLPK